MTYRVEIRSRVLKQIQKLPPPLQQRLSAAIDALATEPKPPGATKLAGERRMWRIKVAKDYRVVYDIYHDRLVIDVVQVGHRREVYKSL